MSGKNIKNRKPSQTTENGSRRAAQIMFAVFAVILILSMVLSSVANY